MLRTLKPAEKLQKKQIRSLSAMAGIAQSGFFLGKKPLRRINFPDSNSESAADGL
jgi:hypothetical protein